MSVTGKLAKEKLWGKFRKYSHYSFDPKGYVSKPEHNLLPGIRMEQFQADFEKGSGNELYQKFRAVHSSSALVVNSFAPWKANLSYLSLCGINGFDELEFEKQCSTGLGGTPPNLDLIVRNSADIIAVESKLLEILTPKKPKFSASYNHKNLPQAEDKWMDLLKKLRDTKPQHLDVAQLIKHYLGLRNQEEYKNCNITLLYLFWEPENWNEIEIYRKHRSEIKTFAAHVKGTNIKFTTQSYPELWDEWRSGSGKVEHLKHLQNRYCIQI